ncbi:hypothetical protein BSQ39_08785 [Loigolactobacillus backii]|uniref:tetratricopeptide repeat protein n=1 Tax=Loigolactobacillus backii TaxID=375175 RepID=UPI000C1CA98D|nr:tetratricopeptide repeat protein [Loigolactobacillus backii]PIO83654.1 hypothetical protein BSQ39_08785 [Loigolactobacillus backii]
MNKKIKVLWQKGDQQGAVKALVAAIDHDPTNVDNYLQLAAFLVILKDYTQAEKLILTALQRFPDNQDLKYSLGTIYYSAGKYDQALKQFQHLTLKRLKNDQLYMLASTYQAKQDYARALAFALTAQQAQPKQTDTNLLVGDLWLALGKFKQAETYYKKALVSAPEDAAANFKNGLAALALGDSENNAYFIKAKELDAAYFAKEKHQLIDIERYLTANKEQK